MSDMIYSVQAQKPRYATFENTYDANQAQFDDNWVTKYFIRLMVQDKPGVLAKIAGIFGRHDVSIESVIQKGAERDEDVAPLILVTHKAHEKDLQKAIEEMKEMEAVISIPSCIRVEEE